MVVIGSLSRNIPCEDRVALDDAQRIPQMSELSLLQMGYALLDRFAQTLHDGAGEHEPVKLGV
jgi:hypothetical protein